MSNRAFTVALLVIALAGGWACWCDTAMLWDGAYQFCETLMSGRAFSYLSRWHSWVVWQLLALLAPHTENYRLLRILYGAPFCFAPLAGAALSWWIVRRQAPHLALWVLFGTVLAPLPGQIFMINDSIFQLHLFWPVLLAAALPVNRAQTWALGALSLFQLSHPMGIGLCLFAAAVALGVKRHLGWVAWLLTLAAGGWLKLHLWPDPYAASEATLAQLRSTFVGGVSGWPLAGLLGVWASAALLVWLGSRPSARWAGLVGCCLLVATGTLWLIWGSYPDLWRGAVNYRRWIAPAAFPLMLAIAWEARRPIAVTPSRNRAGMLAALIFLAVLGTQAGTCRWFFGQLTRAVQASPAPWIEASRLPWMENTAMEHWGLAAQVIMVQGRNPHTFLREESALAAAAADPPRLSLHPGDARLPGDFPRSWFHWGPLPGRTAEAPKRGE